MAAFVSTTLLTLDSRGLAFRGHSAVFFVTRLYLLFSEVHSSAVRKLDRDCIENGKQSLRYTLGVVSLSTWSRYR